MSVISYYLDNILYSDITLGNPPTPVSCLALSTEFRLDFKTSTSKKGMPSMLRMKNFLKSH